MPIEIREFRRSDAAQVMRELELNFGPELAIQGWDADHFREVVDRSYTGLPGWLLRLLHLFGRSPVHLFIAEDQGKVVGTTFLVFAKNRGYLAMVMTDPAYRRRGIASSLLERAEHVCRRRGRRYAVLDVLEENSVARSLYERRHYRFLRHQHWMGRSLPAPRPALASAGTRPMAKADLGELLRRYGAGQPPAVREVLPAERHHLAPPSYLQALMVARTAAWCTGPLGRPTGFLRATFTTAKEAGNLGLPLLAPELGPGEAEALLHTGLDWLVQQGATSVLTEVPAYAEDALRLLRAAGFTEHYRNLTLALDLAPVLAGAPANLTV